MSVQDQEWKTMILVARSHSKRSATFFTGQEKAPVSRLTGRKMHLLVVVLANALGKLCLGHYQGLHGKGSSKAQGTAP